MLPGIAIVGAIIALIISFWSMKKEPVPAIPFPPPISPYVYAIAGEGIIEASSNNIAVGSPFSEIVTQIFVVEGDLVKKGDPLFQLDTRYYEAQAETARSQISASQVNLENLIVQFSFYQRLKDKNAVSEQQYQQAFYAKREAEEQLKVAISQLGEVEANIERSLIHAPVDGEVLQINVHLGEVAPNVNVVNPQVITPYSAIQYPLIMVGTVQPFFLRIDIDEVDAWRYKEGAPAIAFVRGNSNIQFPLKFVRVEPYIIPKASFTGQVGERIDMRVLQLIYQFDRGNLPVYAGQVVDVYIQAGAVGGNNR